MYLDLIVMMSALICAFFDPLAMAFEEHYYSNPTYVVLDVILDLIYIFDMMVIFTTTYTNSETGEEIYQWRQIAKNYLKGNFIIDFLAVFPIDVIFVNIFPN